MSSGTGCVECENENEKGRGDEDQDARFLAYLEREAVPQNEAVPLKGSDAVEGVAHPVRFEAIGASGFKRGPGGSGENGDLQDDILNPRHADAFLHLNVAAAIGVHCGPLVMWMSL